MVNYVITLAAGAVGAAVGVLLEKFVFTKIQEGDILRRTEALRVCFGEPMSATKLTFQEVNEWILARKDQLIDGAKAAVVKVNESTMKSIGKNLDTRGVENYIVLVIMSGDKQIADSLLVKYETLEQELEAALAKGNGVLVVKG